MTSTVNEFKYIIALHFEATCDKIQPKIPYRITELIEFAAVLKDLSNGDILSEFHRYCRPIEKPKISQFCLNYTNIKQYQIDKADDLPHVLKEFDDWLIKAKNDHNLILLENSISDQSKINCPIVTWTNFDINFFLACECDRKKIQLKNYFNQWITIKGIIRDRYNLGERECTFDRALSLMNMTFVGIQHSDLDYSRNLAMMAYKMIQKDINLKLNGEIQDEKRF